MPKSLELALDDSRCRLTYRKFIIDDNNILTILTGTVGVGMRHDRANACTTYQEGYHHNSYQNIDVSKSVVAHTIDRYYSLEF